MKIKNWLKVSITAIIVITTARIQAQNVTYNLKGKIGEYAAPAKAYLMYNNGLGKQIDSTTIQNGAFTFSGILDQPKNAVIYISKKGSLQETDGGYVLLYLESGKIDVISSDFIQNAKLSGGPINADNTQLNTDLRDNNIELQKVSEAYAFTSPQQKNLKEIRDGLDKKKDLLIQKRKSIYLAFIKTHPASIMSLFALKSYQPFTANVNEIEPLFNTLSADVRTSVTGQNYAVEIARLKSLEIGALAPDFTLADTLGKPVSLHDYKGKYVLIDFWASWCSPCRADNPNVLKVYNAYKDKNFTVLSVSLDNVKNSWSRAINEDHLPWVQISDLKGYNPGGIAQLYALHSVPQNFLIGPDGRIVDKSTSAIDLPAKLKNMLSK